MSQHGMISYAVKIVATFVLATAARAQNPTQQPAPAPEQQQAPEQKPAETPKVAGTPRTAQAPGKPLDKAWDLLRAGLAEDNVDKRAQAVHALGLLPKNPEAEKAVKAALQDTNVKVRASAANSLGMMHAYPAKELLKKALDDPEPAVVLAAANSLLLLEDPAGYDVYYAVLTGDRKANKGLVKAQLATLKDKKKMAEMGLDEGIGFIPFAGIPYSAAKSVMKDDASPVRAAAAKRLAHDPDPSAGEALAAAASDKNWLVRAAALEAIAERNQKSLLEKTIPAMDDDKEQVQYLAAACVIRLSSPATAKPAEAPRKN